MVYVVERRRGTGVLASIVGSVVGSTVFAAAFFVLSAPQEPSELGAYHDPNALAQPLATMAGWFLGGLVGLIVALVALGYKRVERAALVVLVIDVIGVPVLVLLASVLVPFGGGAVLAPVLLGWSVVVPAFARFATRPPTPGTYAAQALDPSRPIVLARGRASRPPGIGVDVDGGWRAPPPAPVAAQAPPAALAPPRLGGVDPGQPARTELPAGPPVDPSLPMVVLPPPTPAPPPPIGAPGTSDTSDGRHT